MKAGADMVLMPENFEEAYQGVLDAVADGTVSEERIMILCGEFTA